MSFETLEVEARESVLYVTLNRAQKRNSINAAMVGEFHRALDQAEANPQNRVVVLRGKNGYFCTGMDFNEVSGPEGETDAQGFMDLLKRFTTTPRVVVAVVDGQVMAGGVGVAAACDLVIASKTSRFSLSEALWGLLPAIIIPFIIRRVGAQTAYRMTLTTVPVTGEEAHARGLVDELADDPERQLNLLLRRLTKVTSKTVGRIKVYFRKMWIINEAMEAAAVNENLSMMEDETVKENIRNFTEHGKFPWDSP